MTTFIYIPWCLEQVWAYFMNALYCNYLEMINAQFLIDRHFLGFDMIKKIEKRHVRKSPPTKREDDVIKGKIDS